MSAIRIVRGQGLHQAERVVQSDDAYKRRLRRLQGSTLEQIKKWDGRDALDTLAEEYLRYSLLDLMNRFARIDCEFRRWRIPEMESIVRARCPIAFGIDDPSDSRIGVDDENQLISRGSHDFGPCFFYYPEDFDKQLHTIG